MDLKVIINGVEQSSSGVNIGPDDHIEIKYKFSEHNEPTFHQYMVFIHEA